MSMTSERAIEILYGIKSENLNLDDLYTKDRFDAISMAIKALKEKIERKKKWILCSERLPSYSERIVLATVVRRDKTWNNDPYHRLVTYINGKWYPVPQSINLVPSHMATIEQSDGGQAEVIAWMPLPEPYREEASE